MIDRLAAGQESGKTVREGQTHKADAGNRKVGLPLGRDAKDPFTASLGCGYIKVPIYVERHALAEWATPRDTARSLRQEISDFRTVFTAMSGIRSAVWFGIARRSSDPGLLT